MKVTVKMKPSVNHTRRRVDRDKQTDEQVTITKWKIDINLYLASRELLGKNQQTFHSPKRTKGPEISQLFGETYSYALASAILNHVSRRCFFFLQTGALLTDISAPVVFFLQEPSELILTTEANSMCTWCKQLWMIS